MHKDPTMMIVICVFGLLGIIKRPAFTQDGSALAGSSLARTPTIDRHGKQYPALPLDQKIFYRRRGYKLSSNTDECEA